MKPSIRCLTTALGLAASCQAPWVMASTNNTCEWFSGASSTGPMTFIHNVGTIYVPRDAPVGSVIGQERMSQRTNNSELKSIRCGNDGNVRLTFNTQSTASPVGGLLTGISPLSVMQTNIAGVGVRFSLGFPFDGSASNAFTPDNGDTTVPFSAHHHQGMGSALLRFSVLHSYITLVKTGPIALGTQTFDGEKELFSGRFSGIPGKSFSARLNGSVIQAHCGTNTVSADPVQLGDWDQKDFTGTGYTTTAVPFSITLSDCNADSGDVQIATANIHFKDASAIPFVASAPGVFGLTSDSTAKGIGIQVLKSDGSTPVELNTEVPIKAISASGTVLNFAARFYQTGPSIDVHPGIAKGALNFTLTYK